MTIPASGSKPIFVFGSNLAGRHGAGAARDALIQHGAIYGQGEGLQGASYGIPTKDFGLRTLPLPEIKRHVDTFLGFARAHPEMTFNVTAIGTGLAGYEVTDIAPMFIGAPPNCILNDRFKDALRPKQSPLSFAGGADPFDTRS